MNFVQGLIPTGGCALLNKKCKAIEVHGCKLIACAQLTADTVKSGLMDILVQAHEQRGMVIRERSKNS